LQDAQAQALPSFQSIVQALKEKKTELVKNLLVKVVNINEVDSLGNSLLHYAVMYDAPEAAQYLVDKGASLELKNSKGKTVLALAVNGSKVKLVKILCKRYREDAINPSKVKPVVVQEPKEQPKPVEVPAEKKQKPSLLEEIQKGKKLKPTETVVKEPAKPKMPENWKKWTLMPLKDLQSEDSRLRQESMKAGLAKDNVRLTEISEELAYLAGLIADRKAQAGASDDDEEDDEDWD
jgi:ankyrin repeat protein